MKKKSSKKWLEAGIKLAKDPTALVPCPDCGKKNLKVLDGKSGDLLERWMQCPACFSLNTLRMSRPEGK
jgi:hypothetical protein